jgi:hypothetical protein
MENPCSRSSEKVTSAAVVAGEASASVHRGQICEDKYTPYDAKRKAGTPVPVTYDLTTAVNK